MPDLDYVKLVGRLGITAADGPDDDDNPDTIWCDEGTIRITPLITYAKIAGGSPAPWTAGHAVIDATLSADGYLWHNGKPGVWLVDLTSPKVNPHYEDDEATYRIQFIDVRADGTPVAFPTITVPISGPDVNDLTLISPVPTASPVPIIRGEQGASIQSATVEGGELILELDDGTEVNAGELPVGPGGSDAGVADYITTPGTDTAAALSATIATTASTGIEVVQIGTEPFALRLVDTLGTDGGRRVRLTPVDAETSDKGSQLELVPGAANDSSTTIPAQLLLYNKTGDDYERFTFTAQGDQFYIESTYNGAGVARNVYFQMGGSVDNAIDGQNAIVVYGDASVDLQGGSYSADGKSWGSTRTRVADPANTGDSRLIVDTRTGTPAANVADSSTIEYRRGGSPKWNVGLNYAGGNTDSLDFYSRINSSPRAQLMQTGELVVRGNAPSDYGGVLQLVNTAGHNWRIGEFDGAGTLCIRDTSTGIYPMRLGGAGGVGFWGAAPPTTQPAAPVTLADVIAVLKGCGLAAS